MLKEGMAMDDMPIHINQVVSAYSGDMTAIDQMQMEWFEINKSRLTRDTKQGRRVLITLKEGQQWAHGDALYSNGELIAVLVIKPSLVIRLDPVDAMQVADFCYYIGNRHLPIFAVKGSHAIHVPYDGGIYEQVLAKFGTSISLEEVQLLSDNLLRVKKNHYKK